MAIIKGEKPYKGDLIIPDVIEGTRGAYIVTAIYERAFEHCEDLNSVILPKELQFIGKRAFYKCPNLKTVVINSKLKEIQNEAFMDCVQLSDIVTPQAADGGIEKLGKDVLTGTAFWNEQADGIIYFYHSLVGYKGHKPRKIEIKEGTTCIGDFALFEIGYLKELVFPNSLRTIGAMSCNRNHIKKLIIPEGVKDIGYFAFDRCHDLEFLSLPSTLTSLNVASFFDCLFLQYIIIHAAVPPEVIDDIGVDGVITGEKLYKAPYKIRCLYVPTGSKEAYEKAQYWKYFKKILETDEV